MKITPKLARRLLNIYPPYFGAGIKAKYISEDWKEIHVSMLLHWFNRNAVGTHFGGNLYSMIDPHLMFILLQQLGNEYWVWDKAADIEFVKASKLKVTSVIKVSEKDLEIIKRSTANGDKYFPEFDVEIIDENNDLVAKIKKTLYVRKKRTKQL
jgi:acyl-coenzyme A thioesterase PaaI-like protein